MTVLGRPHAAATLSSAVAVLLIALVWSPSAGQGQPVEGVSTDLTAAFDPGGPGDTPVVTEMPPILGNLSTGLGGSGMADVVLSWDLPGNLTGILNHAVYASTAFDRVGTGYLCLGEVPAVARSFTHVGAGKGNPATFYYVVRTNTTAVSVPHPIQAAKVGRTLASGPSMAALPIVPDDPSVAAVLQSVASEITYVRAYDPADGGDPWKSHSPTRGGDLAELSAGIAFWINVPSGPVSLAMTGTVPTSTSLALSAGWNLVTLPAAEADTVASALAGLPYTEVEGFDPANEPYRLRALGPTDLLEPAVGFWVHLTADATWAVSFGNGIPPNGIDILPGFGNFTYHDDGDNINRPVNVYYYRPANFPGTGAKVVFTMHGSERNAVSARDRMVPYADRYNALLIAPEFSTAFYPDADDYNRGFVKDGGGTGNLRNRSDWTFLTIEELFDVVQAEIPGAPVRYSIQGNSAAGQFISRLPLLVPEARFEVAAGSNSGWYTLPTRAEVYPHGIGDLDISDADIERLYSKNVVVAVGENDTDPNSYDLQHDPFTDAQGNNRYERALFYYDYMRADAAARGVPFNWGLLVVENVGHPAELMAHATAGAVFAGATKPADAALSPIDDTYIDESYPSDAFGAGLELRVDGGSYEMAFLKFDLSSVSSPVAVAMLKIYITNGATGQQFVHEVSDDSWSESSLTWNNAPALGREIGMTTGGEKDGILYVEVTDYINEKIGGLASLAFQTEDTDQLYFSSSEASYFPAQLVLFASAVFAPTPPPS